MAKILRRADLDRIAEHKSDITTEIVEVPEWADPNDPDTPAVMLRVLTGLERGDYEQSLVAQRGDNRTVNIRNAKVKLVALCLVDPDTLERLYSDTEINILGQRSAAAIERLLDAAFKLNNMGPKEVEKLAQGLEKNPNA